MSNDWSSYSKRAKEVGGGGGKFVRLKDGESITFAIMGGPGERHQLWVGDKPQDVAAGTAGAQVTIGLPIYDTKEKCPRLLQLSPGTFGMLADLVSELGAERTYRVSRKGSGKTDTKYTCSSIDKIDDALKATVGREMAVDIEEVGFTKLRVAAAEKPERQPGEEPVEDLPF
jgi:hypothetical protein